MTWFKTTTKSVCEAFTWERPELPGAVKVIIQVIFIAITTIATIYVVPGLNHDFEKNERKSAFYSAIINELNGDTKNFLGNISVLSKQNISEENREKLYINTKSSATKLHWRSVEFAIVFRNTDILDEIENYQETLTNLEKELTKLYEDKNYKIDNKLIEDFAMSAATLLNSIAEETDIILKK